MPLYVNGEQVEYDVIEKEKERLRPDYENIFSKMDAAQREDQLVQWAKENVIERVIIKQEAAKLNDNFSDEVERQYCDIMEKNGGEAKFYTDKGLDISQKAQLKADLELQIKIKHLIDKITGNSSKPDSKDIEEFYKHNKDRFTIPQMLRASHIIKHLAADNEDKSVFEQIQKAAQELSEGAVFEEVVAKYSDCPSNGGDLGYFSRGKMVQDFEDATFDAAIGEVTGIFRTEFGYHIAKITDRKPPRECGIEEVREYIVKQLNEKAKEKAIEKFLDEKMNMAVIKVV